MERLHKILAQATELSRRSAEKAILAGEVVVNGRVVTELGVLADPRTDSIKWKGKKVFIAREYIYLAYHKPTGKIVTKSDPQGRPTIWDDLKKFKENLNTVGRLDFDSSGLMILTNDGEAINRLAHPRHEVVKIYNVKVKGFPSNDAIAKLRSGITFGGIKYQPAEVRVKSQTEKHTWLDVRIQEGKNREVRNMFGAIKHPVLKLQRKAIGPIKLGMLKEGKWRFLTRKEVYELQKLAR